MKTIDCRLTIILKFKNNKIIKRISNKEQNYCNRLNKEIREECRCKKKLNKKNKLWIDKLKT